VVDDTLARHAANVAEFAPAFSRVFGAAPVPASDDLLTLDVIDSPVGALLAGATGSALRMLAFTRPEGFDRQLQSVRRRHASVARGANVWLDRTRAQLAEYFAGQRREFELPLDYPGTAFQRRVWATLLTIPYGETWSYLDVAVRVGDPDATRAVGTANGSNAIAVVIPCHRVINASGELGGYGGGSWRKRLLLDLEKGQGGLPF
jgi:O-6-methylguanine DNA methyltransferase